MEHKLLRITSGVLSISLFLGMSLSLPSQSFAWDYSHHNNSNGNYLQSFRGYFNSFFHHNTQNTTQTQAQLATYQNNQYQNIQYQSSQFQNLDNHQQLRYLLEQHASVGAQAFMARYDQSSNFDQLQQQVNTNTDQLTSLMGTLYGQDKQDQFRTLWTNHINLLTQYTDAVRTNDTNSQQQAEASLNDAASQLASFFAAQQSQVSQDQLQQMFQMHIDDEKGIIIAHAQGNNTLVSSLMQQATQHADMMADMLYQCSQNQNNQTNYQANQQNNTTQNNWSANNQGPFQYPDSDGDYDGD